MQFFFNPRALNPPSHLRFSVESIYDKHYFHGLSSINFSHFPYNPFHMVHLACQSRPHSLLFSSATAPASPAPASGCSFSFTKLSSISMRRRRAAVMAVDDLFHHPVELADESDFDQIVSSDGLISVCGFGSLLSEKSARSTFPDLINFRMGQLSGFRRVFGHAAPIFFERGIAKPETKEISSLSVEPCEGETLLITIFEIQKSEIPAFIEREHEFRFLAVIPETLNGLLYTNPAVLCARYSDEEYFKNRCKGEKKIYFQRYGQYGIEKIWRDDILPCRVYLRHCVLAAEQLGDKAYNNFLDHTYLANRKTTIREYLATTGSGIMDEEPPEPLKDRYGG